MKDNNNEIIQKITERYYNDPAGFCTAFTHVFRENDGTKQRLYPKQISFMNLLKPEENIVVVVKARQCKAADTMIYTEHGPKRIDKLVLENYRGKVWTLDENNNPLLDDVVDAWCSGEKELYEIKLFSGEKIRMTGQDRVNTPNGWKHVQDLQFGDVVLNFEGAFGNEIIRDDEIIAMSYFITDGSYTNANPKFTNCNKLYLDEFEQVIKSRFNVNTRWQKKGNGYDICVSGLSGWGTNKPNEYATYLMQLNMRSVTGSGRTLPEQFLNMPKEQTALLLNRIFAGDGWYSSCSGSNGRKKSNEIGIGSQSLEFLYQIAYLLSKFGIHCNINEINSGKKQRSIFYKLKFSSIEYVQIFVNEIGIYGKNVRVEINPEHKLHKPKNRVMYLKKLKGKHITYDLTTKKYESFISNGIHTHNTGFSTGIQGKALHRAYFGKVPEILITSAGQNQSIRVLKKIKSFFESMPDFMQVELVKNTETQITLANGTNIYSLPANADTCRGFTGDVFLDEYGIPNRKDGDELWEALLPCIAKGYNLVAVSTPKGKDNMFYDLCNPKKDPETGEIVGPRAKKIIRVPWWDVPHIAAVINDFRNGMHPKQFAQEFECEFLDDAEHSLFSRDFLLDHVVDNRDNPVTLTDLSIIDSFIDGVPSDKCLKLNDKYPNGIYLGWDVAISDDGSICTAFGVTEDNVWELIAFKKFQKNTDITVQVKFVSKMALFLGAKKVTFDATGGLGLATQTLLRDTEIRNIINPFKFTQISKTQEYSDLRAHMEREGFRTPKIDDMIREFTLLGYNPITGRIAAMGNKNTNHDDWPSSFICAFAGRKKSRLDSGFSII